MKRKHNNKSHDNGSCNVNGSRNVSIYCICCDRKPGCEGWVYTSTKHVVNNPDDENEWTEYDVQVKLTVENGKIFRHCGRTPRWI